jgi:ssRNA-specific RNase YbeY (16S rRNA maturation enzyme)
MAEEQEQKQVPITIPSDAKPTFVNATQTTVTDDAVVLQFAYLRPQATTGQLIAEIVMSPKHAIDFSKALDATIKKHFTRHLPNE